jgi:hypothetical protein
MKARILLCVALGSSLILGCSLVPNVGDVFSEISSEISSTGLGNVNTEEFDLSGFDKVEVSSAFDVEIRQAEAFSVVVRVDDSVKPYLDVVQQGSSLRIGLKPLSPATVIAVTLEAEVTMPELTGLELSGAADVSVTDFKSKEPLYVEASGASSLRGDIEAGGVRFDVSGASDVRLSGSGDDLIMGVSGASSADLADFPVADANIEVSGASSAAVNVSGRLDAEASGASRVRYRGSPTLGRVDSSGGASIEAW